MEFLVDDAERIYTDGGKLQHLSYWSYKVLTRSFLESYQNPQLFQFEGHRDNFSKGANYVDFCAWHRYSDFEWLEAQILMEFPGIVFPPIPLKESEGTTDKITDFFVNAKEQHYSNNKENPLVMKRMRQLQLTLEAISRLDEIHESAVLKAFVMLDEHGWLKFREERQKKKKGSFFSSLKSKGTHLFLKLRLLGEAGVEEPHSGSSSLSVLLGQQNDLAALLNTAYVCAEQLAKQYTGDVQHWSDIGALCKNTKGAPLPWTACHCNHMVRHSKRREVEGVVQRVDGEFALVQWNGRDGEVTSVRLDELEYPLSGVADPAVFAFQELTMQIDSYCMYLSRSQDVGKLKDVEDALWFVSEYAKRCVKEIRRLREMEYQIEVFTKAGEKKQSSEQIRQLKELQAEFSSRSLRFASQFDNFYRPYTQKLLIKVADDLGMAMEAIGAKGEWESRLSQAFVLLNPSFDNHLEDGVNDTSDDVLRNTELYSENHLDHVGG